MAECEEFVGYTTKQLEWKNTLNNDRDKAFASMACELSNKFDVEPQTVINLVNKHFWDVWDAGSYVRGLVRETYTIRDK